MGLAKANPQLMHVRGQRPQGLKHKKAIANCDSFFYI